MPKSSQMPEVRIKKLFSDTCAECSLFVLTNTIKCNMCAGCSVVLRSKGEYDREQYGRFQQETYKYNVRIISLRTKSQYRCKHFIETFRFITQTIINLINSIWI